MVWASPQTKKCSLPPFVRRDGTQKGWLTTYLLLTCTLHTAYCTRELLLANFHRCEQVSYPPPSFYPQTILQTPDHWKILSACTKWNKAKTFASLFFTMYFQQPHILLDPSLSSCCQDATATGVVGILEFRIKCKGCLQLSLLPPWKAFM